MPVELGAPNAVNAVLFVARDAPWHARSAAWLARHAEDPAGLDAWLALLQRRAEGVHAWDRALAGATLPGGRPMPPVRRYNDALAGLGTPDAAPLLACRRAGLRFVFDVWGPGEAGGEPGTIGLELLVHRAALQPPEAPGPDPEGFTARRIALGDAFAALMAEACETLAPRYAASDGMQPIGDLATRADGAAAPLAAYAWALAYWAPERVDAAFGARLGRLTTPPAPSSPTFPDGVDVAVRTLTTGGPFLRARRILGAELRGSRARLETPLARALGLRSTATVFRS